MNANQGLVLFGAVAFMAAGIVWIGRATSPEAVSDPAPAAVVPSKRDHGKGADSSLAVPAAIVPLQSQVHHHQHDETPSTTTSMVVTALPLPPVLPLAAPASGGLASPIASLSGRADTLRISVAKDGPQVALPAMPTSGRVELVVVSTLGGLDAQRRAHAAWTFTESWIVISSLEIGGKSVDPTATLRAVCERGVWRCVDSTDPVASQVAIECSRTVEMLRSVLDKPRSLAPGQEIPVGGEAFRVIVAQPTLVLLAASVVSTGTSAFASADDSNLRYPTTNAAWNDLGIWLDGDRLVAAERLVTAPATVEEPGWYVRRLVLRW